MSEPTPPRDAAADGHPEPDDDATNPNIALGIVFGMLGLGVMLALEDTRIAGLPFLVLGITFFVMGIRPSSGRSAASDEAPTPDSPAPEGDAR